MNDLDTQVFNLKRRISGYKEVLENTVKYRKVWKESLRQKIEDHLQTLLDKTDLQAEIEHRSDMENLEAIELSLGQVKSGIHQSIGTDIERHLIKNNGSLIYQQLFNGKIIVLVQYPYIENYGKPRPPKTIAIYRPEELSDYFCIRHMEEFIHEITNWEDFDDDEPNKRIGFDMNFGGGLTSQSEDDGMDLQ